MQWSAVDGIAEAHCAVLSSSERVGGANGLEWYGTGMAARTYGR
jgi:hypothetical protein